MQASKLKIYACKRNVGSLHPEVFAKKYLHYCIQRLQRLSAPNFHEECWIFPQALPLFISRFPPLLFFFAALGIPRSSFLLSLYAVTKTKFDHHSMSSKILWSSKSKSKTISKYILFYYASCLKKLSTNLACGANSSNTNRWGKKAVKCTPICQIPFGIYIKKCLRF